MINVGVIGFGLSAKTFHIPFICALPEYTLTAICTSQTLAVSKQHPQVAAHRDAQSLLAQQDLQLVVITAPNDVHFSLAKQCLEAGKHLIIEKPITSTVAEAETLAELAERHQRQVSVYHNRRWDGDLLTIAALLEQKNLGDLRLFESHFDRFRPTVRQRWREQAGAGTGSWYDLGSHLVDQALHLFGAPIAVTGCFVSIQPPRIFSTYYCTTQLTK